MPNRKKAVSNMASRVAGAKGKPSPRKPTKKLPSRSKGEARKRGLPGKSY